jgi:translation initiation factor IF-1
MENLKSIIKEVLENYINGTLIMEEKIQVSDELQYHIDNKLTLTNNVFRVYSEKYFDLVNEVRNLWKEGKIKLNEEDTLMVESDLGLKVKIGKEYVYLDAPFIEENWTEEEILEEAKHHGKNVKLGKPFRTPGGPKKFAVYVRSKNGGVKKVTFGDPNLRVRNKNKGAAKSFRARHKCDQKKDRTTAGYWSCNVGRYSKQLGLSSSNSW